MPDLGRIAAALRDLADAIEAENGTPTPPFAAGGAGRGPIRNTCDSGKGMVLSAVEFGARFGRSAAWAKALCRAGVLPGAFRLPNGAWRVPEEAVAVYVESQQKPADVIPLRPRSAESISDWRKVRTS
jgi:hypothetical protein